MADSVDMEYFYRVAELEAVEGKVVCGGGCGWEGAQDDGAPIESCSLTPGDASPACRCPECDSLAYPADPDVVIARIGEWGALLSVGGDLVDWVTEEDDYVHGFINGCKLLLRKFKIPFREVSVDEDEHDGEWEATAARVCGAEIQREVVGPTLVKIANGDVFLAINGKVCGSAEAGQDNVEAFARNTRLVFEGLGQCLHEVEVDVPTHDDWSFEDVLASL